MSEHQKETAFLRHIIRHGDSDECRNLENRITQIQNDQRCVQRVASVTALFPLLAIAAVGYEAILQENFPHDGSELAFRLICVLGLASLICLMAFAGLLMGYRLRLNRVREECRQSVIRLLESHLSQPHVLTMPDGRRASGDREAFQSAAEVSVNI
jgi:hypothetical protein